MKSSLAALSPRAFLANRPGLEYALCLLLKRDRLRLPPIGLNELGSEADGTEVRLQSLPQGRWATPLVDVVYLLKLVLMRRPASILEIGCYKGHTTALLARHAENAHIVTVDIESDAGGEFIGTELEARIDRRVGPSGPALFRPGEAFDLIFIDADHTFDAVKKDTELCLPMLSPGGLMVWHDYANWGYFSGHCGVPEYLAQLAQRLPVRHLAPSNLAVYSPAWRHQP